MKLGYQNAVAVTLLTSFLSTTALVQASQRTQSSDLVGKSHKIKTEMSRSPLKALPNQACTPIATPTPGALVIATAFAVTVATVCRWCPNEPYAPDPENTDILLGKLP